MSRYAQHVTILVRSASLAASMSQYLIREIEAAPNIDVRYRTEVAGGGGDGRLEQLRLRHRDTGDTKTEQADGLFVLIGAQPYTGWLPETVVVGFSGWAALTLIPFGAMTPQFGAMTSFALMGGGVRRSGNGRGRATFDFRFGAATEVVGGMKLRIWMAAPDADDLDVFVAVQKLDAYGDLVGFPFYAVFEDGPVALGWLRASHRELDQARSRPWQPVLAHQRPLPLAPGEIVPLEIEILPSGTRFGPGETLRLVVQGRDIYRYPRPLIQAWHDDLANRGRHVIYSGGGYDSHLLVPVLAD